MTTMDSNLQGIKNIAVFYLNSVAWTQHVDQNRTTYTAQHKIGEVMFTYYLSYTNKSGTSLYCHIRGVDKIPTGKNTITGTPIFNGKAYTLSEIPLLEKDLAKALYIRVHEEWLDREAGNLLRLLNKDNLV